VEIDIILEPDLSTQQIRELAVAAERYGIRALWMSNYFAHWDPFVALVPVVMATKRLRVGALALSPFEMHPLKIANAVLSLNELSGGRAEVSIGAGEGNLDAMALGKPQKIVGAIREAVEIVIGAGTGRLKAAGYKGEHFQVTYPCAYEWLKSPPPRVYLGAYRHQMMRAGARVADAVFIGCTPLEILDPAIAAIREGLGRRETQRADFKINSFWAWHLKKDRKEGYRESRRELAWRARKLDADLINLFLSPEDVQTVRDHWQDFVNAWFDRSGNIKGVPDRITNALCEGFTSTGGLEDLDREIERFRQFGVKGQTTISLRLHDDPMEALDIIGKHVVPRLK